MPALARSATTIGYLSSTQCLNLAIGLPLRDRPGLTNLLQQIYAPANARCRPYLTPQEFAARFGPTANDYAALITFAHANGLAVVATHPNRLLLDVRGTVADVERACHIRLQLHQHPREVRTFFAPDADPSLNLGVAVADISGLDNYVLPHPMNLKGQVVGATTNVPIPSGSGSLFGAFAGSDFRAAYLPGVTLTGVGETVGLVQFDGFYPGDIATYKRMTGLPNVPVKRVMLDGFNGTAGRNNPEVALDIELVLAMAPGLAQVIVYEGEIPNDVLNRIATDNQARQVSCSWGWTGYDGVDTMEAIFLQFAAQGQSFFAASGDSDAGVPGATVDAPEDEPNIVSVGGTTLVTGGAGGPWLREAVWNWGSGVGSGGGVSPTYALPPWQQGLNLSACHGSPTQRNYPDVAMVANSVFAVCNNGQLDIFGGTSCAAPLWAGLAAVINQQAAINGLPPIGFLNPALYALGKGKTAATVFHDIVVGDNMSSGSPTNFAAVPGYDLCTGWGTPAGSNLVNALAPTNLLQNGGFETGDFSGWTLSGGSYAPQYFFSVIGVNDTLYDSLASNSDVAGSEFVRSGSYGALLGEYGSIAYLSQTFATSAGQPYLISFWLEYPYAGTPNAFQVLWNGAPVFDQSNLAGFGWTNVTFTVLATNTTTTLAFGCRSDPNAFGLDDVRVEVIPIPALQSLTRHTNGFVFVSDALPGASYQPQVAASLPTAHWSNLGASVLATDTTITVLDPAPTATQRFYRIALPP